jgi:Serine incorporator (Serinc)
VEFLGEFLAGVFQLMYFMMVVLGTVIALVFRYWGHNLEFHIYSFEGGCTDGRCTGIQGVYRVSFALALFFLAMALLSKLMPLVQRGGWFWKYIVLAVLFVVSFLIPNGACGSHGNLGLTVTG